MKIHVEHVCPPVPVRDMDYRATFEDYEPGDPMGWGSSEQEAISALGDADEAWRDAIAGHQSMQIRSDR